MFLKKYVHILTLTELRQTMNNRKIWFALFCFEVNWFDLISFHSISFCWVSFPFLSCPFISFHFVCFHFILFGLISFHFAWFDFISFCFLSFCLVWFHFTLFGLISCLVTFDLIWLHLKFRGGRRRCLQQHSMIAHLASTYHLDAAGGQGIPQHPEHQAAKKINPEYSRAHGRQRLIPKFGTSCLRAFCGH